MRKQIIKSLSYDMAVEEIAAAEELSIAEVRRIAAESGSEVAERKRFYEEMRGEA